MPMETFSSAVTACLGVHTTRIQRQRVIKQRMREEPIVEMTKREVQEKRLVDCVLQDDDELLTFALWWTTKDEDYKFSIPTIVMVKRPTTRSDVTVSPVR